MPGFDGSGPRGAGPMTGRGQGYCIVPLTGGLSQIPALRPPKTKGGRGRRKFLFGPCAYGRKNKNRFME
ncbi:DUF5320 domain-containing protein [Desulfofundulus thermosubterraneus]|uniref:DUF5320 domain-containing protein n=1 Tax=Desulfofundulus thermosubterraneus TaxID=348840 RepID=UPI000934C728